MLDSWMLILLLGIAGLAVLIAVNFIPAVFVKGRQRAELQRRCRGKLALTYDDGPDPLLTRDLVRLLERFRAKASFFLVGFRAARSPAMSELLRTSGHELGCHTDMHLHSWSVWPWRAVTDVNEGYRRMSAWMPAKAPFRPPFGKLITWTWLSVRRRGARLCWWTHDGADTWPRLPEPARVAREIASADGAVVLMHSHDRGQDRHEYVLALTEELLKAAQERGWQVCTMSQLLADETGPGGTHGGEA